MNRDLLWVAYFDFLFYFFVIIINLFLLKIKKGVREGVGLVWGARARKEEETMGEVSESTTTKRIIGLRL